ncbi:TPA: FkbM family methyltransferase [Campylobacter lari]|uniref:FkbM family methyltransferase n=1 Tax=Campylobacter sp. W0066.2 TaxID=2735752 RepID=UPI002984BE98|nr:FkbM family methyltransferase [Campylobacter sp. W0066.2]HEG2580765.1 FkbM family methyltransferase [Campylobacter lari]
MNRPLPFILASTDIGTIILNHLDQNSTQYGSYGVGYQFLHTSNFDKEEIDFGIELFKLKKQYTNAPLIILDCGANIGAHTIKWAKELTGWGEIIAFEAQERIYYALAGNIAINNCFNAKAIHSAVGNPTPPHNFIQIPCIDYTKNASFGSLEIQKKVSNEFIGQTIDYNKTQKISYISIDSLKLEKIDFIKIDVEGMEINVLNGAIKSIKKFHPILQIEFIKSDKAKLINFLQNLSYVYFYHGINIIAIHNNDPILQHITFKDQK